MLNVKGYGEYYRRTEALSIKIVLKTSVLRSSRCRDTYTISTKLVACL